MFQINGFVLAFLFAVVGLLAFGVVRLLLHGVPRLRLSAPPPASPEGKSLLPDHGDAVMVIAAGGRVERMNPRARQIFGLQAGEVPHLERLARRVRPGDALIRLCAAEGRARFVLDSRMVEGTSYLLPAGHGTTAVVSLRYPDIAGSISGGPAGMSAQTLQTFTQLSQAMAASLDLGETLQTILENIEKLLPADLVEATLWDPEAEAFVPYRFSGLVGEARKLERAGERYPKDQGLSATLARQRKPLLIADIEARPDLRSAPEVLAAPMRSYLGLPLIVGAELIGTLVLGSLAPDTFHEADLDLLRLLSGQAAIAIHNALLYHTEQERTAELTGLAQLAQAFSSIRNPGELFVRLVESIAPLVEVDIVGFLIYNEAHRTLEARVPFHGLPDPFVELYQTQVPLGSAAEKILLDQDLLITENASEDEKWTQLGIASLARVASLRETVLVPLSTGGHMLGYLQASNHSAGPLPFSQAELHLLLIVANQTASIIENAGLVQQSRQRAMRAEALRRIASLAGSNAHADEVLLYSLQELARLLHADASAIFLLDKERGQMGLHRPSLFGPAVDLSGPADHILVDDPQYHFTVSGSQHVLMLANVSDGSKAIIPFYQALLSHWSLQSLIAVPLVMRNEGIGELWLGSRTAAFFEQGDAQVVATAAGQLAGVVEQSALRSQTDESLRRRVDQLTAINRISHELSTSLDLTDLLNLVYDESLRTTRADCGTILMFDLHPDQPQTYPVRFFVGDLPDAKLSPSELFVLQRNAPLNIPDFSQADFQPPHPGILSMLVVPISHQRQIAGLICLHGKTTAQFDETAVEILQSLAVQASVALNNALAYEEQTRHGALLSRDLETLSRLIQVTRAIRPGLSLQESLSTIALAIQSAIHFEVVVISVCDPETQMLQRVAGAGLSPALWEELQAHSQPWQNVQQFLKPEYRSGQVYYIPEEQKVSLPKNVHTVNILPVMENQSDESWHREDMLLVPMYDAEQHPLGLISVDAPADNRRPDRPTMEALEIFAGQVSIIVESRLRAERLAAQTAELEREKARLEQSAFHAQNNLPVMLHKELEQAIALRGLNQRIDRIRASLEIAALANRQETESGVLHCLGSELLTRFAMQVALVAEITPGGIRLLEVIGSFPAGANPEALFGQRNPLRQMLQTADKEARTRASENHLVLVSNLEHFPEWQNNTLLTALEARSMIGMPLEMGADHLAGVLAIGQGVLPAFLEDDRRVFAQLAHQVSIGLKNVQLLNETRRRLREVNLLLDFSRKLGSLQPDAILATLVENVRQVLPAAQTGWAGLWEEVEQVVLPQAAVGYASQSDILGIRCRLESGGGLLQRVFATGRAERVAEVNFAQQYQLTPEDLLHYRTATGGRLPVSLMLIPLEISDRVQGVMFLENFDTPGAFAEEDEALAASFTRQAAMVLENAQLFQASERRATQLHALTRVAGTMTSSLKRDRLISSLLGQVKMVLPYDTATLWLRAGSALTVASAAGFADNDSRLGLAVAVEDSGLFKAMIQTNEPILVEDLRKDERFPSLVEPEYLSWLGIPLIYKSEVAGAIALEKREAGYYSPDQVTAGVAFASQAAVALENARLYEESTRRAAELDERSQRMAWLNRLSSELVASLDVEYIFRVAGQQLLEALGASGVAALMMGAPAGYELQVELPEPAQRLAFSLPQSPLFERLQVSQGIFQTGNAAEEPEARSLWQAFLRPRGAHSLMVVPLISGSATQGWFLVYGEAGHRYAPPEIELARTMCNQTAIAIQNARLFGETRRLTEDLERRVEARTHELRREHQNSQTLLRIITELSASLDMGLVLNRTLLVLNESLGSAESLIILPEGNQAPYRAGAALTQSAERPDSIERQIARWVLRSRQPVLVERIQEDGRWAEAGTPPAYQSVMAVPLVMGEEVLGALLLFHAAPAFFTRDQIGLMEATARQIAISLNNAELFNLIRDQSEHLGSMLREQQIEASRSRAILEAVADGVVVTDARNQVTLFNESAEQMLALEPGSAIGKPVEHFAGLFGSAAAPWMDTIRSWSQDPSAYANVETYADRLALNSGIILAVHLAPVFWRQEYLGTVSIFRDITHEVQVDRLKSEFVANVSHELRTPMTSIKGYVEIMLMGAAGALNPQQTHFLQIVRSNTDRLAVLVNDLLDISRIEAGRISLDLQPLDLRAIAGDVIADIQRRAEEEIRPMTFILEASPDLPMAQGDLERIRQVLGNLVSNGYNYTEPNGCVTVSMGMSGEKIQVSVTDNGIGIDPMVQHRIFERFYRGEDSLVLASAGTGLGLSIARTLIEMHHGTIWFKSSGVRGQGSVFSFTLPVYKSKG